MPSIRETLREMGVSAEQVLTELAQISAADNSKNGTVPTPLTNYLDVRHFYMPLHVLLVHIQRTKNQNQKQFKNIITSERFYR